MNDPEFPQQAYDAASHQFVEDAYCSGLGPAISWGADALIHAGWPRHEAQAIVAAWADSFTP